MSRLIPPRPRPGIFPASIRAFSLIELLVTVAVLLLVLGALVEFTATVQRAWLAGSSDPFAEAGESFETLVGRIENATLEPYQDYVDATGNFLTASSPSSFAPDHLARRSDLAFVCGPSTGTTGWLATSGRTTASDCLFFVSPRGYSQTECHLGLERLLNADGYFVEFGDDDNAPLFTLGASHRWRWRLKEICQPAENLSVYQMGTSAQWIQSLVPAGGPVTVVADNVAALIVLPERAASDPGSALTTTYDYDSRDSGNALTRHQMPARLRLAMVVIDEPSAALLAARNGNLPPTIVPTSLFSDPAQMDADIATLDASLNVSRINHRILRRDIVVNSAAFSPTLSQ